MSLAREALLPLRALLRIRRLWLLTLAAGAVALALGRDADAAIDPFAAHIVLLGGAAALVLSTGSASGDHRTGVADLWLQKPGGATRHALARCGRALAATVLCHMGLTAAYVLADPSVGMIAASRILLVGLFADALIVSVVFGFSGLGVGLDVLPALGVVVYLGLVGEDAVRAPDLFPTWGPLLRAVRFPLRELAALHAHLSGSGTVEPWAWLRIVGFGVFWLLTGVVGLRFASGHRSPRPLDG